jgi:hypothetical protein
MKKDAYADVNRLIGEVSELKKQNALLLNENHTLKEEILLMKT